MVVMSDSSRGCWSQTPPPHRYPSFLAVRIELEYGSLVHVGELLTGGPPRKGVQKLIEFRYASGPPHATVIANVPRYALALVGDLLQPTLEHSRVLNAPDFAVLHKIGLDEKGSRRFHAAKEQYGGRNGC